MNMLKIFCIVLFAGIIMTFGSEIGERLSILEAQRLVPTAEARVGRPLTPVSVAGTARRTVRRCAAGVYNCRLFGPQSLDSLLGQISSDPIILTIHHEASTYYPESVQSDAGLDRSDLAAG